MSVPTMMEPSINRVGFIVHHLPCQCGISTFTTDLWQQLRQNAKTRPILLCRLNALLDVYLLRERE